jgi:hypothetical protein
VEKRDIRLHGERQSNGENAKSDDGSCFHNLFWFSERLTEVERIKRDWKTPVGFRGPDE